MVDDDGLYTFLVPTAQYSHAGTCYKIGCTQSWGDNFDSLATRDSSVALFTNSGSSIDPVELVASSVNRQSHVSDIMKKRRVKLIQKI